VEEIMTITRWDPFREVATLQNRMNSLFQDFSRNQGGEADLPTTTGFVPPVDVYEDGHKIVLKLEVPGIKQDDLDIRIENNTLTVRGERKFEKEEKEENFHRIERRYGSFFRAFTLPTTVDTENVKANYDSGVLRLELDKRAEAKPKQIKIGVTTGAPENRTVEAPKAAA
jgi:HSP20 family protein